MSSKNLATEKMETREPKTQVLEKCPICGSKSIKHFFTAPDKLHGVPGKFSYFSCQSCESVFQNPMVIQDDLHLCYPTEYMPYNYDPEMPEFDFDAQDDPENFKDNLRKSIAKEVWNEPMSGAIGKVGKVLARSRALRERAFYGIVLDACLPRNRKENHALDVGCGAGWMLKRLKRVGWQVEGIEWGEEAAELARQKTGAKVWTGDFREVDLPKEHYQLIFLSHVFEHFSDPSEALKRFYELLASKGKLVLIYPNPNSLDAKWFNTDWFAWEVPRHLTLPSVRAVREMARKTGFVNLKIKTGFAGHLWGSSKAYKVGLHPEKDNPALSIPEKMGFYYQYLTTKLGGSEGSEIIAVLEKP